MTRYCLAPLLLCLCTLAATAQTVQHPFTFTHVPTGLPSVRSALAAWADVDGDGDLDLFLSGYEKLDVKGNYALRAHLYRNQGILSDPRVPGQERPDLADGASGITPVAFGDAAWGDYDRDGDLDLVVLGSTTAAPPYTPSTTLYRNSGGTLTAVAAGLPALHSGQVAWADFDGDGDLDLLLTGTAAATAPYTGETHLMLNTNGTFAEQATALPGLAFGTIVWRDFAGDPRPDVLLSGLTARGIVTERWEQQTGAFVKIADESGVLFGRAAVSPRGAGQQFALTGAVPSPYYFEGNTRLTVSVTAPQLFAGGVDWGDLDGDGDLDFSLTGLPRPFRSGEHHVYQQVDGAFREQNLLLGTQGGPLHFLDYDGDGDLDLFSAGEITALYRNDRPRPAVVPPAPGGLVADVGAEGVTLRWDSGGDASTYDVWVGTAPDRPDVVAPPLHPATGRRMQALPGSVDAAETFLHLPAGTYFWGVQRISGERVGSAVAVGQPFTIAATASDAPEVPTTFGLDAPSPSPFSTETTLRYHLPVATTVRLAVYNVTGQQVRLLMDGAQAPGTHPLAWDGRDDGGQPLASGLYLCRIEAGPFSATRTLFLVR